MGSRWIDLIRAAVHPHMSAIASQAVSRINGFYKYDLLTIANAPCLNLSNFRCIEPHWNQCLLRVHRRRHAELVKGETAIQSDSTLIVSASTLPRAEFTGKQGNPILRAE